MRTALTLHLDSEAPTIFTARYFGLGRTCRPFGTLQVQSDECSLALHVSTDQAGADLLRQLAAHAAALADRIDGGLPRPLVEEVGGR